MKKKKWIAIFAIILLLLLWLWSTGRQDTSSPVDLAAPATYAEARDEENPGQSQQLLVDLQNDISSERIQALEKKYRLKLALNSRFSKGERLYRAAIKNRLLSTLLGKLRQESGVELAEPDLLYGIPPLEEAPTRFSDASPPSSKTFPNDPQYRYQWHLDQINMPQAWRRRSGQGVIVAVIDTGVAYKDRGQFKRVPDLAKTEFVEGYDFVHHHAYPLDDHGHGTHVAGTIAQSTNNGLGVAGVAYRARIMPLKVLSARGFGSVADIAEAIRFAADHGAQVINMSLGGNRSSKILAAAVRYAHQKGVVVVCAAGNEGRGRVSYPAAYPGAIGVAATQFDKTTTFYSNWGKEIDVAAPGGNTRVDQNGDGKPDGVLQNTIIPGHPAENDYLLFMGTSMASPHVAGVAALVVENGVTNPDAVEKVLKTTAHHPAGKKRDDRYGAGIIDAGAALSKTTMEWGAYKLGLSTVLALLLLLRLRERKMLDLPLGPGLAIGLLWGSAGLFFLPSIETSSGAISTISMLLSHGVPAWDTILLGPTTHANPLFYSVLPALALAVLFYSWRPSRGLLFGFAAGLGGHLLFHVLFSAVDVVWIPNILLLDQAWLLVNALACLGLASLLARR